MKLSDKIEISAEVAARQIGQEMTLVDIGRLKLIGQGSLCETQMSNVHLADGASRCGPQIPRFV